MKTVGVISDTHGLLRDEALTLLQGVDHIIHAGDVGAPEITDRLAEVAPVSVIKGNVDTQAWAERLNETVRLTLFGAEIFVLHDLNDLAFDPAASHVDLVISGHSHKPGIALKNGVTYLNPGSAGPRRFSLPVTLAKVKIGSLIVPEILTVIETSKPKTR